MEPISPFNEAAPRWYCYLKWFLFNRCLYSGCWRHKKADMYCLDHFNKYVGWTCPICGKSETDEPGLCECDVRRGEV